jgi:lipid-A-disaccharide synthase
MINKKKIFITAGEPSGDLLGGKVMNALKSSAKSRNIVIEFVGVGGEKMESQGLKSIFSMKDLSVMGFFEVLLKLFKLLNRINKTVKEIIKQKPDIILTIDSPGFSFMVMKKLKSKYKDFFDKVEKVHLIAPSIWAYNEKRAKKVANLYNLLLCILPFEPPYFEKYGLRSEFIGHPIFDDTDKNRFNYNRNDLSKDYSILPEDTIIILTPGSREAEVERIFPIMIKAIDILKKDYDYKYRNSHIFTFVNNNTNDLVEFMTHEYEFDNIIIFNETEKQKISSSANIVLAKSGTNTFEFNIFNIPLVIVYSFSWLTNRIVKRLVKIKYANLVNIMAGREIIPEFILDNANPVLIADELNKILSDKQISAKQIQETIKIIEKLGYNSGNRASVNGANKILELLLNK